MHRIPTLWRANIIVFISSFCVMVIELIASRILAPYIGVSLYTWTSIIGVILAGIALGNYLGGKLADREPSPVLLTVIFLAGSVMTILILPAVKLVTTGNWFSTLPMILNITLKTSCIFFLPAIILSMVSPMVIKLTLGDLGQTGGIVGTIYAVSTAGAILGTFMTGFFFILWFGLRMIIWLVAAVLMLTGLIAWFSWKVPNRWKPTLKNVFTWLTVFELILVSASFFQMKGAWNEKFTRESNYFTIEVAPRSTPNDSVMTLRLDHMVHSYTDIKDPTILIYGYTKIFEEITAYMSQNSSALHVLHLGGGGYTFPRYMASIYPQSVNDVVEIDPAVTQVAYQYLGLSSTTPINTYNQDARQFLIRRKPDAAKYDIIIGDVFNDRSTPYHLTTVEFDKMVRDNLKKNGIYMVNLVDDYLHGRYLPSFINTLEHAFDHVYLFRENNGVDEGIMTFVILASMQSLDEKNYTDFITMNGTRNPEGILFSQNQILDFMSGKKPLLLTDDYAPTGILVAPLVDKQ